ncbi:uncharacterized protein A4U43_C07F4240 [Asparagus officinalis]|uniref:DNA N(6)-methyladenine demethylase n=1 Tax=Asparagus officinalis TaxID=4686 RepID=A0A5P1E9Q4_ASPOF|nr:alpha-ketoglutarate-dependent dioxygenase abh1-like [Asparagus officinalis]ONK62473.1 uncharacterized protein A4U43_C07F4240 [Asparagus officinalis]
MLCLLRLRLFHKAALSFSSPFYRRYRRPFSSSKEMRGFKPPDSKSNKLGSSYGRGSVSAGNSSIYGERSVSPIVGPISKSAQNIGPQRQKISPDRSTSKNSAGSSGGDPEQKVFDICRKPSAVGVKLQKSLLEINREKRKEAQCSKGGPQHEYVRPGMVLLKKYISHDNQVMIVKKCRELGIGLGGFYRPGYGDGAKLRLQMMCLGKNWDPESRKYDDKRPTDGATPPRIPEEFTKIVEEALRASYDVIKQKNSKTIVEEELPWMSPDLCIVNFYNNDGRLGLHQDRDESEESLQKGLPVVSFSIGDSAEFLYGDVRDEDKAKRVLLESGDVLIFGGKSRWIFHGVPSINQNTAPKRLVEDSNLRPGRLNLTFRKY